MSPDRDGGWEYKTVRPARGPTMKEASDPETVLNELGADGWEFTGTIDYVGGGTKYLIFKRKRGDGHER